MISGQVGSGGGGGSSLDPSMLAGMATQAWVEDGYISKAFWNELFIIHKKVTTVVMDGTTEISRTVDTSGVFTPNEIPETTSETDEETGYVTTVTTEISSIESKKGFWTNYFISALGLNGEGGGGGLTLNEPLATINVSGLANHPSSSGQTIVWNGSAWVYGTAGGGTGTVTGVKVGDVTYSPVNGIVSIPAYPTSLAWSAITSKPTTIAGYGITDAKIENGVITLGSNTITPLTSSAISDMATKTWVGQQGFITSSAISDMATKTWVGNNYLPLTGGTLSINGIGGFTVKNTASNYPVIRFEGNTGGGIGFIGIGKTGDSVNPYYVTADSNGGYTDGVSQWNILLHSGNYTDYTYSKSYIDTELAKKLDVAFFDALFQAYAGSTKVTPNASTSSVDNIKAMFGFWTQQYISALGKNDSQGVVSALSDLSDVTITSPSDGQALIYDGGIWKNGAAGMNMSELTTYLSSKILTVKNGTATLGTWNPTAAGTIDIASAVSGYLPLTGGTMTGQIQRNSGGVWATGNSNAIIKNTSPSGTDTYNTAFSCNTLNGDWSMGTHGTEDALFAVYNPTGNTLYNNVIRIIFPTANCTLLGTNNTYVSNGKGYINGTEITSISGYLPLTGGNITGGLSIVGTSHQNFAISSSAETSGVKWTGMQFQHVTGGTATMYGGIRMDEQNGSLIRYDSAYNTYKICDAGNTYVTNGKGYINGTEITAISGNANTASRLQGSGTYTAWGQTYWQNGVPQSISGNMTSVGSITMNGLLTINNSGGLTIWDTNHVHDMDFFWNTYQVSEDDTRDIFAIYSYESPRYWDISLGTHPNAVIGNNGIYYSGATARWGVKTLTPVCMFDINGYAKANRLYLYKPNTDNDTDAIYLEYNSANGGVHLVGGGLYADTYVSALGLSDSGGSAFDETAMWQALGTTIAAKNIALTYIQTAADTRYALKTDIPTLSNLSWSYGSVTSASGNSYNGSAARSFVIPKNTSHLTNDSGFITSSALGAYLPLTGGTLSLPGIGYLTIKNTASDYPLIRFEGKTVGGLGFIGVNAQKQPVFVTVDNNGGYTDGVSQWNMIWHSGNDSTLLSSFANSGDNVSLTVGSTTKTLTVGYATRALRLKNIVMDAGDDYDTLSGYTADRGSFVATNGNAYTSIPNINDYDTLVSFGYGYRTFQIKSRAYYQTFSYRTVTNPSQGVYRFGDWKTIAFTDSNVASATRLAGTATKSAWGRTYWSNGQPQDISGNIEYTGHITPSASYAYEIGARDNYYRSVYCGYFNLIDPTTNEDFNITWRNTDNKRVLAMYCWETVMSDMILGATDSSYGLYFDGTNGRWGIGTSVPGQRFGSENVGLKLDVAGIARANVLQTYNSYGETMLLNSTSTYDCIVFQINSASKWSVGADSSNNFYWYTQPGGGQTVMYLTSAGVLNVGNSVKCTDLWIGNIHITYDSTNGGIHVANGGLSANTYVSALGVGQEGGGTQGLDIEALWTELGTPNTSRQIDPTHISVALAGYVTTSQLSGYATQQWVTDQDFAYASSLSNYVSAVSMSSGQLNVTKGGSTTSTDIMALRLGQSALGNSASLSTFTHSTDLIYTAKGGSNTCTDKPTGVDSFGLIALKTADGYYGQMLMTSGGEVYTRASNSLSGGWRKQLDSSNWSSTVTLSALGGASTVALTEATTRISTLEGYFNTGGVAKKAAKFNTAVTINGTSFDGSASITTRSWGTARTITLSDHDSSNTHANNGIDGSENITLYLPSTIKATLNGNASSATTATTASKLSTVSKTAWGQTYWTSGGVPADVSGSIDAGGNGGQITGFHSIELNNYGTLSGYGGFIDFHYNGSSAYYTARFIETNYGLVKLMSKGSNGNDQRAALVIGEGYTSSYIQIGDIRLVCDSNHDLRVVMASGAAANLYATGGISALGMSAGTSSIDEMTFGYLNVNNELNFGSSAKIYMDDFFYIESDANVSVNGVEFENNNAHASKLYLGNSQYLYVSGGTLYYYNGSSSKVIS